MCDLATPLLHLRSRLAFLLVLCGAAVAHHSVFIELQPGLRDVVTKNAYVTLAPSRDGSFAAECFISEVDMDAAWMVADRPCVLGEHIVQSDDGRRLYIGYEGAPNVSAGINVLLILPEDALRSIVHTAAGPTWQHVGGAPSVDICDTHYGDPQHRMVVSSSGEDGYLSTSCIKGSEVHIATTSCCLQAYGVQSLYAPLKLYVTGERASMRVALLRDSILPQGIEVSTSGEEATLELHATQYAGGPIAITGTASGENARVTVYTCSAGGPPEIGGGLNVTCDVSPPGACRVVETECFRFYYYLFAGGDGVTGRRRLLAAGEAPTPTQGLPLAPLARLPRHFNESGSCAAGWQ